MSHAWSVLSLNVVRFVLKRGPFCPAEVRFVLAVVRFVRGPFCPWSVMSLIQYKHGIASDTIPSHSTIRLTDLHLLDGCSFANVHVKGIVAFKHKKKKKL